MIWHYRGPVYRFEHIHSYIWDAYTTAPTMGKALSNLASRYKKENGLEQSAKIILENMFIHEEEHNDNQISNNQGRTDR